MNLPRLFTQRRSAPTASLALLSLVFLALANPVHAAPGWEQRAVSGPSPRCEFGFAYDSVRGVSVLFGGSANLSFSAVNRETWEWNGTQWSLKATTGPSARCDNALAFDSNRGVVVSFGGYNGAYLSDTWEWNGTQWQQVIGAGPAARADAFMAFDSNRHVMVLFGGQAATGAILRDTWEYNGAWVLRATGGPPPARWIHRMAFDRARGVVVMYAGASPSALLSDVWEWNGTSWTQRSAGASPARYANAMCFDVVQGASLVYGGQSGFGFGDTPLGDTWKYDGATWTNLQLAGPPARTFTKMVYDESRQRAVLFGGWSGGPLGDTWELLSEIPTPAVKRTWGAVKSVYR
jgi:hypothetical protein